MSSASSSPSDIALPPASTTASPTAPPTTFPPNARARFRRALLNWYDRNQRDLPWRNTRDPYAIWLSEIMLQQTRVAAVLDHYRKFLDRFPNLSSLAAASEDAVLARWSGLGYYRRARMLHRCAREVVHHHDGRFPESAEALQELPGIGRYTAAAIASIAFGRPSAVVDGNVERVLQRINGRNMTSPEIWESAQTLLSKSHPGDFNQALMELGATQCLPREPRCEDCPVQSMCATRSRELSARGSGFSALSATVSPQQTKREIWCLFEQKSGHVRLVKRSKRASLMAGMWEMPQISEIGHESAAAIKMKWRTFRHSITVTDYTVHVLRNSKPGLSSPSDRKPQRAIANGRGQWVAIQQIPELPITGLTRKVLKAGGII